MKSPDLVKHFIKKWREKYGENPSISFKEAGAFYKQRLSAGTSPEKLLSITDFFFDRFNDPFVQRCHHSFSSFRATYNSCLAEYREEEERKIKTEKQLELIKGLRR